MQQRLKDVCTVMVQCSVTLYFFFHILRGDVIKTLFQVIEGIILMNFIS